jgi:hypothetical protein
VIRLYDELREPLAMINAWRAACRNFLTYDKAGGTNDGWWLLTEEREKERERERETPRSLVEPAFQRISIGSEINHRTGK